MNCINLPQNREAKKINCSNVELVYPTSQTSSKSIFYVQMIQLLCKEMASR